MTDVEIFELILGIKEIQVNRVDWQDGCLHIYCVSILEETVCPHCSRKREMINQTYERRFRNLPIKCKEVYLHLTQRQFYCPDCHKCSHSNVPLAQATRRSWVTWGLIQQLA
jgi:transposase